MSLFRVLIADALSEQAVLLLQQAPGISVDNKAGISYEHLLDIIPHYEALLVRSRTNVDAKLIAAGSALRVIGRAGIGVDNVDPVAATRAGIVVMNTPEGNAVTTAEHTLALMFSLARNIPQATASMKLGKWEKTQFIGREIHRKTLGILGLGNIGKLVAQRAQCMGVQVLVYDPFLNNEAAARLGITLGSLEQVLTQSDIITVHTPLNEQTRGLLNDQTIAMLKTGVLLINCARGGIYDEEALLRGLNSGKIAGLALDVFVEEPPPAQHPLLQHPKVICTPHLGASTTEAQIAVAIEIAQQVIEFAAGGPARNAVNLPRIDSKQYEAIAPAMDLAKRMGTFCGQLAEGPIKSIHVQINGSWPTDALHLLTPSVIIGALQNMFDRPMNWVNARICAEERGIQISSTRTQAVQRGFANTLEVHLITSTGEHRVMGSVFSDQEGRFIEVDGVRLEALPKGCLLYVQNYDQPGVIGHLGTVLGQAQINISQMHLALEPSGGRACSIIHVDRHVPSSVIQQLQSGHVIQVRQVLLD